MSAEVLIVDGDPHICSALTRLLRGERLTVTAVTTAAEALELLGQRTIGVVLCDQELHNRSGLELIAQIQERSPRTIKVLMVRQMAEVPSLIRKSPELKFQVMMKPWSNMELVQTINHAVQRYRTSIEAGV